MKKRRKIRMVSTGDLPSILIACLVALFLITGRHLDELSDVILSEVVVLVVGWLLLMGGIAMGVNWFADHFLAGSAGEESPAPEPEIEESRNDDFLKYLWLRAHLVAAYQLDPYEREGMQMEAACVPVDMLLPRHVYEKLAARAEEKRTTLSEITERMAVLGMADDHLTLIVTQTDWVEQLDQLEGTPWS